VRDAASARQLYSPDPVPSDPARIPSYLTNEFAKIQSILNAPLKLEVVQVAPDKPRNGDVVEADGTNFNPGAGAGTYIRRLGAWVKWN
jgi:hypothetical protein